MKRSSSHSYLKRGSADRAAASRAIARRASEQSHQTNVSLRALGELPLAEGRDLGSGSLSSSPTEVKSEPASPSHPSSPTMGPTR